MYVASLFRSKDAFGKFCCDRKFDFFFFRKIGTVIATTSKKQQQPYLMFSRLGKDKYTVSNSIKHIFVVLASKNGRKHNLHRILFSSIVKQK